MQYLAANKIEDCDQQQGAGSKTGTGTGIFRVKAGTGKFIMTGWGQRKFFITGQAKLNPSTIQLNALAADNFTNADIFFLLVIALCYRSNRSKNHAAIVFIT